MDLLHMLLPLLALLAAVIVGLIEADRLRDRFKRDRCKLQPISADSNPGEGEEKDLTIPLDNQSIPRKFAHYAKEHQ